MTGRSASIPPWCGRISTPPGHAMRCPRSWSRGAPPNDKNRAPRPGREALGRSRGGLSTKIHLAADRRCRPVSRIPHRRPAWRLPAVHPAAGAGPHRPPRERTAAYPARPGEGRQGVLIGGQPLLSTPPRHRRRHPGQGRPEETPPRTRPGRRPPARLRRRTLPRAQHRRALLQQAQAVPRCRDPLSQARLHVPGHGRRRLDPDLATKPGYMIYGHAWLAASAAWSEVMEIRNRTVPCKVPFSDGRSR